MDADRRIPMRNCANLRDVGGYPAAGGRVTRWRTLLRSGSLHYVGDAGVHQLHALGVRTVIDLRTRDEAEFAPTPPLRDGTATGRISLIAEGTRGLEPRLDAVYRYLIEQRGAAIASAVRMLSAAGGLPALVHCSAGKDRTGVLIGLVLSSAGVPDEVIAGDYALSAGYLGPRTAGVISQIQASVGLDGTAGHGNLLDSPAALFRDVLAWARAAGGGTVDGYLTAHGVTPAELAALRDALTEPAGSGPGD